MKDAPLTRSRIAQILERHRDIGAKKELARRAKVQPNAVSMWLAGGPNSNLDRLGNQYAHELLKKEDADKLASGDANGSSVRHMLDKLRSKTVNTEES